MNLPPFLSPHFRFELVLAGLIWPCGTQLLGQAFETENQPVESAQRVGMPENSLTANDWDRLFLDAERIQLKNWFGYSVPGYVLGRASASQQPADVWLHMPDEWTTEGNAAAPWWRWRHHEAQPLKVHRIASPWDKHATWVFRTRNQSSSTPTSQRNRGTEPVVFEIRLLNAEKALAKFQTDADQTPRFVVFDLLQKQVGPSAPTSMGWPWSGSRPGMGACPPGWQPAFSYDTNIYPFANNCIDLGFGEMHYMDESPTGTPIGTVLMLHGNPTWSFLYREIAPQLVACGYRVVGPDFYGFGLSEKPSSSTFGYTPHEHADILEDFVEALDLHEVTALVQDWGGATGFAVSARLKPRLKAIMIMNTWGWNVDANNPGVHHIMIDWSLNNINNPDLYLNSGVFVKNVADRLGKLAGPVGSPEYLAVRDAYWGPFLDSSGVPLSRAIMEPTNIFAQNILFDVAFMNEVENSLPMLGDLPMFIVFGHTDRYYGALVCDIGNVPECPPPYVCTSLPADDYCLENGDFVYPFVDRFKSYWQPPWIVGEFIDLTGKHFIQEYVPDEIVEAVKVLNRVYPPSTVQGASGGPPGTAQKQ